MLTRRHIPNLLTFARVLAVPVCLALILLNPSFKATALLWIFFAASLTDFLDGYLARKWNVVSPLGTLLDPIADKLLVALMLIYLLMVQGAELLLPIIIILLRELYISGLREFLAIRQITLPVSKSGKWKTALQMIAIGLLLAHQVINPPHQLHFPCSIVRDNAGGLVTSCINQPWLVRAIELAGQPTLYLAALLAFTSALSYTRASWKHVR